MAFHIRLVIPVATILLLTPLLVFPGGLTVNAASDQWINWATTAWGYFSPGVGVSPNTGLHYATLGWHQFTDWDLGVYLEAIIDAEKLGILTTDGAWGANYRIDKILSFLETRQLSSDGLPYWAYSADSGQPSSTSMAAIADSAKLLLALDDLRHLRPDLTARINSLVARYNFQKFAEDDYFGSNDMYPFYVAQGYWAFGYSTPKLRPLGSLGNGNSVEVYGESLPKAEITSEPLMLAVLENRLNATYKAYADTVFMAQQKRYETTGKLTAFSEGPYFAPQYYVYEWVVNSLGETWVVYASGKIDSPPIIYSKIAFAFHAIHNNQYTSLLVNELSGLSVNNPTSRGFYDGKSENGEALNDLSDKTNGMILAAARYAVQATTTSSTTSSVTTSSSPSTGPTTTSTSRTTSPQTSGTTATSVSTSTTTTGSPVTVSTTSTVVTSVTTVTIAGVQVQVVSNSSVSVLIFDSTRGLLNFTVSGPTGSYGFFDATIAKSLISGQPIVMMDGVQEPATVSDDANFWYVHMTYMHSQHHVTIGGSNTITEFPSVPLLTIVLTLAVAIFERRHKD